MSEFNKILGRDFIIAFLLPALFFLVVTSLCLEAAGIHLDWLHVNLDEPLKETTILALEAFVVGVLLQSVNRELFRLAEGYWWEPVAKGFGWLQKKRFKKLRQKLQQLREEKETREQQDKPFPQRAEYNKVSESAATRFPQREDLVLPTTFGNVVRAYEDYARVMYGFESITGWSRLQALFSKQSAEILSRSRARVDMWLNVCFVTVLIMIEFATLGRDGQISFFFYLLPVCFLFAWFAYRRALSSALRYGEQVKALVDIYLPQLCKRLGFTLADDVKRNREFWQAYSRAMVYRDAQAITEMALSGLKRIKASNGNGKADSSDSDEDD